MVTSRNIPKSCVWQKVIVGAVYYNYLYLDKYYRLYKIAGIMDKIKLFRQTIKINRILLERAGFKITTINSWIYTDRVPDYNNAKLLAGIIGCEFSDIPHYRSERVI